MSKQEEDKTVFLITTYIPGFTATKNIVNKNWGILSRSSTTKKLSEVRLIHGYRRPKHLWDDLVRAKLPKLKESQKNEKALNCDTRNKCKTVNCRYCTVFDRSACITSTFTGHSYFTRKNVTCKSTNLIYCITCKTCKMQYVGQTKLRCMDRIQAHFNTIQSKYPKQQTDISRYFKKVDHNGREDVIVHILNYAFPDTARAALLRDDTEFRWTNRLRSQLPMGMNTMDNPRVPSHAKKSKNVQKKKVQRL